MLFVCSFCMGKVRYHNIFLLTHPRVVSHSRMGIAIVVSFFFSILIKKKKLYSAWIQGVCKEVKIAFPLH